MSHRPLNITLTMTDEEIAELTDNQLTHYIRRWSVRNLTPDANPDEHRRLRRIAITREGGVWNNNPQPPA